MLSDVNRSDNGACHIETKSQINCIILLFFFRLKGILLFVCWMIQEKKISFFSYFFGNVTQSK